MRNTRILRYDENLDQYYLRARYYDQGAGRFTQMDSWIGRSAEPTTLNKYVYGNADPANVTDPTGHFGLASFSAANSIRSTLSSIQIDVGLSLLDSAFSSPGEAQQGATNSLLLGVASLGGPSAFKLLRMLSGKFRKACAANSFTGDTLVSTENGLKPIDQIVIGDRVWAYDEESGENTLQEVIHLIAGEGEKSLVDITLASGEVISATIGHPMYSMEAMGWVDAGELTLDDVLRGLDGSSLPIMDLRSYGEELAVYNLTVAEDHTFYVSDQKTLTHNSNCRIPHRLKPRIEQGNDREGWIHIQKRHIPGAGETSSQGDLFAQGTSIFDLQRSAAEIVKKGRRMSDVRKRIQTFENKMIINGKQARYRLVVDSDDSNRIITMFPIGGG